MTPERRKELRRIYRTAVKNASQSETRHAWMRYLTALYKEAGDLTIFHEIRGPSRNAGGDLDRQYLFREIDARQLVAGLKTRCAERYARALNRYGLAAIEVESAAFRAIIRDLGPEVLQTFEGVDHKDMTAVCIAMAKTWNQLVRRVHRQYDLPSVQTLRAKIKPMSEAEKDVLDSDDFETRLTPRQRLHWEAVIGGSVGVTPP